jgi:hypothetical protein
MWKDPNLAWDPQEYGGLASIRVPASFAFEHDIKLLNSADERLEEKRDSLLVIYSEGDCLWIPRSIFRSICNIDLKMFPFDRQNCSLSFGSWVYDSNMLNIDFEDLIGFDMNDFEDSKEWRVFGTSGYKHDRIEDNKSFTVLTYYLVVDRNPGFYTYILILPCMLLATLTMTVFWLPPESPTKIILGLNIFTALFLLLLLLAELVPTSTNEVPYIGEF